MATMLDSEYGAAFVDQDAFTALMSSCGVAATSYPHSSFTISEVPMFVISAISYFPDEFDLSLFSSNSMNNSQNMFLDQQTYRI